jgi:predicted DNA-binding transcriptional regulator
MGRNLTSLQQKVLTSLKFYKRGDAVTDQGVKVAWIAKNAGVSATSAYNALRGLEKKGLAKKVLSGRGWLSFWTVGDEA